MHEQRAPGLLEAAHNRLEHAVIAVETEVPGLASVTRRLAEMLSIQLMKRHRDVMFRKNCDLGPISVILTNLGANAYEGKTDSGVAVVAVVTIAEKIARTRFPGMRCRRIDRNGHAPASDNGNGHSKAPTNGNANGNGASRNGGQRQATQSQVKAIHAIARNRRIDIAQFLNDRFRVDRPDDLNIKEASQVIDELKGETNAEGRR